VSINEIKRVAHTWTQPDSRIISANSGYFHSSKAYYKENPDTFLKILHNIIGNAKAYIQGTYHGLGFEVLTIFSPTLMNSVFALIDGFIRTKSLIGC